MKAAVGVTLYVTGAICAMLAGGLGWALLDPPRHVSDWAVGQLDASTTVYSLPPMLMVAGVAVSWSHALPRWTMVVFTLHTPAWSARPIVELAADLVRNDYHA